MFLIVLSNFILHLLSANSTSFISVPNRPLGYLQGIISHISFPALSIILFLDSHFDSPYYLTKKEIIANTISDIEEHCSIIAEFSKQNDELLESIADLNSINTKKSKLETIEFKLNGNITKLEKENQFFNLNDDCPTCRQNIDNEFKLSIINKNNAKILELQEGNKKDRKSTRLNSSH